MKCNIFFATFLLSFHSLAAYPAVTVEGLCFRGVKERALRLELRIFSDSEAKWRGALVKYNGRDKPISLVTRYSEESSSPVDMPSTITTVWLEIYEGAITGEYELMTHGASVDALSYRSFANSKITHFFHDSNTTWTATQGCIW